MITTSTDLYSVHTTFGDLDILSEVFTQVFSL